MYSKLSRRSKHGKCEYGKTNKLEILILHVKADRNLVVKNII